LTRIKTRPQPRRTRASRRVALAVAQRRRAL